MYIIYTPRCYSINRYPHRLWLLEVVLLADILLESTHIYIYNSVLYNMNINNINFYMK